MAISCCPKKQYRLLTPTGFQNVLLSPTYYGTETGPDVNVGCRHNQTEQIAQQFLNNLSGYHADANTLVVSIGRFNGQLYARYTISTVYEFADVCGQVQGFSWERASPS